MGLFGRDRYAEQKGVEAYERTVNRMKGTPPKVSKGRAVKDAPAPYTCGRTCRPGHSCTSTVRGGVCPCRWC